MSPIKVVISGVTSEQVISLGTEMLRVMHSAKLDVPEIPAGVENTPIPRVGGYFSRKWTYSFKSTLNYSEEADNQYLVDIIRNDVASARAANIQTVRYWDTPEDPFLWSFLLNNGVTLLNTDHVYALHAFLTGKNLEV